MDAEFNRNAWFTALEKTAQAGELILNSGKPNYKAIMSSYYEYVSNPEQDRSYKTAKVAHYNAVLDARKKKGNN